MKNLLPLAFILGLAGCSIPRAADYDIEPVSRAEVQSTTRVFFSRHLDEPELRFDAFGPGWARETVFAEPVVGWRVEGELRYRTIEGGKTFWLPFSVIVREGEILAPRVDSLAFRLTLD